ncbi:GNAT family N-acetyltransferase [Anatilimnocola sp. NA78]|uniref:GNAT family N-acetyltransferase n=1 Tax=Anatilimnocola sp. NA78 TaxID=3415683 RepID=UPI003CE546DD
MPSPAKYTLSELLPGDYDAVMTLWNTAPGVRASETREEFERILLRNPGLSTAARVEGEIAGAVLCCHDGRRGYLYHLAVADKFRRQGIARELVARSLNLLEKEGIGRCTIFLVADNAQGKFFWEQLGWFERTDLVAFAKDLPSS